MPTSESAVVPLAQQLLDAQVRFHLLRLGGEGRTDTMSAVVDALFDVSAGHQLADLIETDAVKAIVARALVTVPSSGAIASLVELVVSTAYEGPADPYPLGDLVQRAQVEVLVDRVLALSPVLERALERLTDSPLVGTMASRFMGRIVGEVVQANQAVADRVPGLGSLMSFGTSAASKMMGAADKQLEGLLGETVGKGGTFAVRRLNRIIIETVRDPTTREAVLQVWDLASREPVGGLSKRMTREEVDGVVDAVHELTVTTLASEQLAHLGEALVDALLARFGAYTATELLVELDLDRADLVATLVRVSPGIVDPLLASGYLERILRAQLEPFFASGEVGQLLS